MTKPSNEAIIWFLIFILALIWGSSFILIKRGLVNLEPLQVAGLRVFTAGVFLLPWSLPNLKKIPKDRFKYMMLVGIVGNLIPAFLFAYAQLHIKSSMAGMLNGLTPVFTLLIGAILFSVPITKKKVFGLFIGLIGSSALLLIGNDGKLGEFNSYALLVILATICYGTGVNFIKARLHGIKATITSSTSLLFTLPFGLFYLIFDGYFTEIADKPGMIESSLYVIILGTLGTAIALMLFYKLVELSNPLTASTVTYLIPFVAILWGVFDGERLFALHYLSLAIIILGVYLINRAKG